MTQAERNLELWGSKWPLEAFKISQEDWKASQAFITKSAEPLNETLLQNVKTLFIFGFAEGESYLRLSEWLHHQPERHLHILTDRLDELQAFMEWEFAEQILRDPQVTIAYLSKSGDNKELFDKLYWINPLTAFAIQIASQEERYQSLSEELSYQVLLKNTLAQEYMQFAVPFFRNFYSNLSELPQSKLGTDLFGQFEGIPAIICGAGPSLTAQIPQLKALKSRALIFGGGSALNALAKGGLVPHFGAGIDPNAEQAERLKDTQGIDVPFFYRLRIFPEALKLVKGQKLYIPGAGGYDVAEWFEKRASIDTLELDEGHNVVNFCTEIALRMGCNPIIYVGVDLAYTGGRLYAEGVHEAVATKDPRVMKKDIHGEPVETAWKWIAEAKWISEFAEAFPHIQFLNATGAGLGIPGVPNVPLEVPTSTHNIPIRLEQALLSARSLAEKGEILQQSLTELKESLQRCLKHLDGMVAEVNAELLKAEPKDRASTQNALVLELDLFDEPAYHAVLDVFHQLYARLQNSKASKLKEQFSQDAKLLHRGLLQLQLDRLHFLKDVVQANLLLIPSALG